MYPRIIQFVIFCIHSIRLHRIVFGVEAARVTRRTDFVRLFPWLNEGIKEEWLKINKLGIGNSGSGYYQVCFWPSPKKNIFHTIRKVKFLSKNSILTKPKHFHEFFTQFFWQFFSWSQSCQQLKSPKPQHFHEFFTQKKKC